MPRGVLPEPTRPLLRAANARYDCAMIIRPLGAADAPAFRELRIRALRDHPEAFGRTPQEVDAVEVLAARFAHDAGSEAEVMLGAFDGPALVGVAGCHREPYIKHRHVAYLWGVYVP